MSVCVCDLTIAEEKGEGSHPILPQSSGEGPTHTHTGYLPALLRLAGCLCLPFVPRHFHTLFSMTAEEEEEEENLLE